ncbi:MAG: FAD-dependent oxidoreductase, partial [Ramlibacter sp.]|nr:FAD-dependent oxidoreductase [Ramlibacter sp.]
MLIAGGGIGGLAAALALARQQIPSRVIEQADAWAEVGAGIQLGPNVVRVLKSWGLGDALQEIA